MMVSLDEFLPLEFFSEVKEKGRWEDVLMVASVPVILTLVSLLPKDLQVWMMLDYQNPQLLNLFTSAYVHAGFDHYLNNLTSYFILIVPLYLLCILADERRTFLYTFLFFLLVLPWIISGIDLAALNANLGRGFSGVDSAFLGFLPVAVFLYLRKTAFPDLRVQDSIPLFLVAFTEVSFIYTGLSLMTIGVSLVAVVDFLWVVRRLGAGQIRKSMGELFQFQGYGELALIAILFYVTFPFYVFPASLESSGGAVNILGHYSGLALGNFVPYLYQIRKG